MGCCNKRFKIIRRTPGMIVNSPEMRPCSKCGQPLIPKKLTSSQSGAVYELPACSCGG